MINKILDDLTQEAMENTDWKATSALRCAKKELLEKIDFCGKWISVKDRLPTESDGTVLVCYPNQAPYNLMEPHMNAKHDRRVATGCYSQHSRTWYHGDMRGVGGADPIAWMPLPEPPKEEEHADGA